MSYHPIVKEFLAGNSITPLVLSYENPGNAMVKSIKELMMAAQGKIPAQKAWQNAQKVDLTQADPLLTHIFFLAWHQITERMERREEGKAILARARNLIQKDTPPEFKASLYYAYATHESDLGNVTKATKLHKKGINLLSNDRPRKPVSVMGYLTLLAGSGRLAEEPKLLSWLQSQAKEGYILGTLKMLLWMNEIETGQLSQAQKRVSDMMSTLEELSHHFWFVRNTYYYLYLLYTLGKLPEGVPDGPWDNIHLNNKISVEDHCHILSYLFHHQPQKALALARKMAFTNIKIFKQTYGLFSYNMIRAELTNGNPEAALRCLEEKAVLGNDHGMDHFFYARVALQEGQMEKATHHMKVCMEWVKNNNAQGRLNMEWQLATECSTDQVFALGQATASVSGRAKSAAPKPVAQPETTHDNSPAFIGQSPAFLSFKNALKEESKNHRPLLLIGALGTGKTTSAKWLHAQRNGSSPFLTLNCSELPTTLLLTVLFGMEKAAYTGAEKKDPGLLIKAEDGVVYISHTELLPKSVQKKLVEVLSSGTITAEGGNKARPFACKLIFGTQNNPAEYQKVGLLRPDFLKAISSTRLTLPKLSEREDDVLRLAVHFLKEDRPQTVVKLDTPLQKALASNPWPGQITALAEVMQKLRVLNSDKTHYTQQDYVDVIKSQAQSPVTASPYKPKQTRPQRLAYIKKLFKKHKKLNRVDLARIIGITLPTATQDLKTLTKEGFIKKVMPTRAPKTHYFELK